MQKLFFLTMAILSCVLLKAADSGDFIRLPAHRSSSGIITVERVNINQLDKATNKTFKSLIDEAQEDNAPWAMVAYWCSINGSSQRCYAASKTIDAHPHHNVMRACEYYQIKKEPMGKYNVERILPT